MYKRIVWVLVAILAIALLVLGLQLVITPAPQEEYVVKIGYKPNGNYLPLFVALENGYFEEERLKVETVRFDSTNTLMDAFAAGQLDATPTGNAVVSYSLEGSKSGLFKIYGVNFYTDERHPEKLIVRKGSGIQTYQDFEGKTIGTNKGVFARTMITKFLEKKGVKNFQVIELDDKLQVQALKLGQVDALASLEPNPTIAVEKGIGEEFPGLHSPYKEVIGFNAALSISVISSRFLEEHPKEAKKFLLAMKKSFEFIEKDLEKSKAILPRYVPIEASTAQKIEMEKYDFFDTLTGEQQQAVQKTADFLFEQEIIKKKVDAISLLLRENFLK